jgi:ClpP class serine protease
MGFYTEYLDANLDFQQLSEERKKQLERIAKMRGSDVLVYAADLTKGKASITVDYSDLLPITDQLANLSGKKLDFILETPGGSGEVAEDIIRLLRAQYDTVSVIVPGWAKSAGTIIAMAGDEILMGTASALGPIDAQLAWQGKQFSADALLEGFEKIKKEVLTTGNLNKAYIPILGAISPGELQSAENALKFAKTLVTDWLTRYKFKTWVTHSSTKKPVTPDEKAARAQEIAEKLCDHKFWLTHGRSIKLEDLETMGLRATNYSNDPELADAIGRYHTLLQMTFATNVYKVFETPTSQIFRFIAPPTPLPAGPSQSDHATIDFQCNKCKKSYRIQANLRPGVPLEPGAVAFPNNNKFKCPYCGTEHDLSGARRQIEMMAKKPVVQ